MTIQENTICGLIQSFPVLVILAQNNNKCLKTPFIYKPPSPTHAPEYYEALDALFQSLFGHEQHGYNPGYSSHSHNHGHSPSHGYAHNHGYQSNHSPCAYYGKKWQEYGVSYRPCYQYVYPGGSHHSPYLSYKSGSVHNVSGVQIYSQNYAPDQVYETTNNKYRVVVKKTRIGGKRKTEKKKARIHSKN